MMKKMKGVVTRTATSMEKPPPYPVYEDSRTRFRHQTLLQDYEELYKDTESRKRKLKMMKQKKLSLLDEIRFLRRRQRYLIANQSSRTASEQNPVQPQNLQIQRKKVTNKKNCNRREAPLAHPAFGLDSNQKGKLYDGKEATLRNPIPVFDLNQKLKTFRVKEPTLRHSSPVLDLNQKERVYGVKEATPQNMTPVFDLNQISREEEELQCDGEPWRVEESKRTWIRGGSDEQLNDMKLSACRNIGNGANRTGKRKITWQDQVALRV
ncbi:hypothetical protein Ddye_021998 [Dipteronia dyeriana]|uniref:Uncharacterized protein n=1 Tax=Dipteronia dyeriana TaxID=168575 RepID=A0AAD9WY23_9ROSI|nr:hypothetical protein Ddye_021998 [Dipteronia dyeriana]